jgi:hypothetical protein
VLRALLKYDRSLRSMVVHLQPPASAAHRRQRLEVATANLKRHRENKDFFK